MKVPFKKIKHNDSETDRFQGHVEEALNQIGVQTLDDWPDGDLYKRPLGVNHGGYLTASGLASGAAATNIGTIGGVLQGALPTLVLKTAAVVSGANIATNTVAVSNLATANQFSVYRNAAFTCPAGVYSALYADKTVKDSAGGWSAANAWYQIPAPGDWWFSWCGGVTIANSGKEVAAALVINSGVVLGGITYSSAGSQTPSSAGSYLYCNALAGDRIKVQVFNGDSGSAAMFVGSGANFFVGYQVR